MERFCKEFIEVISCNCRCCRLMIKTLIVYFKSTLTFEIYNQNELMNLKKKNTTNASAICAKLNFVF